MFARILEFIPKREKKEEIVSVVRKEVLPILKKQPGFLEFLPFVPETDTEKAIAVTLWAEKVDAERYERGEYSKVEGILKPYLSTPVVCRHYEVQTALCQHFAEALWYEA